MRKTTCSLFVIAVVLGCAAKMVNVSWDMRPASRVDYGYTPSDPIRIGYSKDLRTNVYLCETYMAGLRTSDQRTFKIVARASVDDPKYKPEQPKGFLGLPLRNGVPTGGILDLYLLVPSRGTDTVRLYFDIYHKDTLLVPAGLYFVPPTPQDTGSF